MDIKKFKENWRGAFRDRLEKNEKKQVGKFYRYFKNEYYKGIESYVNTNSEREFSNLFKIRDIENLYINLYEEVGVDFAKWYARSFDKFIQKNSGSESTWRTTFSRIGQTEAGDKIALVQGTALKELKRNIGTLFKDPEFQSLGRQQQGRILQNRFRGITEYQSQRIVRTEATSAANEGIMQSSQDIFPKSSLVKEWISSQDGRTRSLSRGDKSDHLEMNGKVVGFDETFAVPETFRVVQMRKPADFRSGASAHNIVNCRCSLAVYPKEGAQVREGVSLTGVGGGVSARTSQLIGDEIVTARKPVNEITSRERAREFTSKPNQAKSIKEGKQILKDVFKGEFINIESVVVSGKVNINKLNKYIAEIDRLSKKYIIGRRFNTKYPVKLRFKSTNNFYGRVSRSQNPSEYFNNEGFLLRKINFGDETSSVANRTRYKGIDKAKKTAKSAIDADNIDIATVTHEFAHIISTSEQIQAHSKFWKDIRSIKRNYADDLKKYLDSDNKKAFNNVYLGEYASTNIDEFYAEAFTEYELNSNPSKYARQVGELVSKYFQKEFTK